MRHPLTSAEKTIWNMVRNNQLGYKIRRQHPIDRFITDFYCPYVKLIIEIDGDSHSRIEQNEYDLERTAWLGAKGYSVIRFENDEVKENPECVVENIQAAIFQLVKT
jgi:very-short-patch-repair endonuclease